MKSKISLSVALLFAIGGGLQAAEEVKLDAIEVASDYLGESTEDSNSYGYKASKAATGLELSILKTPQSTDALTSKNLKQTTSSSYEANDALNRVVGVSFRKRDPERFEIHSRNSEVDSISIDGVTLQNAQHNGISEVGLTDTSLLDRIEIVRGATGLMKGAGEPSANINLVRKVPHVTKDFARLGLSYGSWDFKRVDTDLSYALNKDRSIRARLNFALQDRDYFVDRYKSRKGVVAGVVDFDIGDSSLLRIGADYINTKNKATMWSGLFRKDASGNTLDFPIGYNFSPSWASSSSVVTTQFLNFRHFFDNDFELDLSYNHQNFKQDWYRFDVDNSTYINGNFTKASSLFTKADRKIDVLTAKLSGDYEIANIANQFALTLQSNKNKLNFDIYKPTTAAGIWDSFDFSGRFFEGKFNQGRPDYELADKANMKTTQNSISLINNTNLTDNLSVLLGLRLTKYSRVTKTDQGSWYEAEDYKNNNVSKYFGLTYEYIKGHTIYASITDIFTPQAEIDENKKKLKPIVGTNYEIGLKSQFLDGNINTNLAVFETRRNGVASFVKSIEHDTIWIYEPVNGAKTRGFEVGLSGNIGNLNIYGGYTYAVAKDHKKQPLNTYIPTKTFKFALDYEILKGVNVGGDYSWRNATYLAWDDKKFDTPAFGILNLHANYQVTPKFKVQANINNALNKKHILNDWGRYTNGEPRNFMLRAEYEF